MSAPVGSRDKDKYIIPNRHARWRELYTSEYDIRVKYISARTAPVGSRDKDEERSQNGVTDKTDAEVNGWIRPEVQTSTMRPKGKGSTSHVTTCLTPPLEWSVVPRD